MITLSNMEEDDKKLVKDYLKGDENAFEKLVAKHLKPIYNFVYRLCGNPEESRDITQEVFFRVWKNIKKFDPKNTWNTWIYSIARNATIDYLRKKKTLVFSDLDNEEMDESFANSIPDQMLLPDEIFEQKELGQKIENALMKISFDYRTVVVLHLKEGLTFEEISKVLKKPMNTVKSQYRRALSLLRDLL